MTSSTDTLERRLLEDLGRLGDRLADERLVGDLYRALAGCALHAPQGGGRLALSWSRAEELLDDARSGQALARIGGLAQSGGEGELTHRASEALDELGWSARPRTTDHEDPAHVGRPESPPPRDAEPPAWERQAHAEAERERHRRGD